MNDPIIVSIRCTVFNHGPYLRQCLDGFVMQKTNFRFEAFVHDDASTDDSAAIILEYARKYPDIIKPYIQKDNLYSKKDGSFLRMTYNPEYLKGKYIAICEGDDYWIDPLKLQKQVDYLETHPNCSMCFGNAIEHWEDGSQPDHPFSTIEARDYSGVENCWKWLIPTVTIVFRKELFETSLYKTIRSKYKFPVGDLPLILTCASYGQLHAFSDYFAVYRKQCTGFTMNYDSSRRLRMGRMWKAIPKVFGPSYGEVSAFKAIFHFRKGILAAKSENNRSRYFVFILEIIWMYISRPINSWKRLKKILQQRSMVIE